MNLRTSGPTLRQLGSNRAKYAPAPAPAEPVGESSVLPKWYSGRPRRERGAENSSLESAAEPTIAAPALAGPTSADPRAAEPTPKSQAADPDAPRSRGPVPLALVGARESGSRQPEFVSLVPRRDEPRGIVDDEDPGPKSGALVSAARTESAARSRQGGARPGPDARRRAGASSRPPDPTLPAILEFQRPSAAIVNAPMPALARGITWIVTSMVAGADRSAAERFRSIRS